MAEDQQKPVADAPSTVEEVVVAEEKPVAAKDAPPSVTEEVAEGEKEASPADEPKTVEAEKISQSVSFKEESNVVSELPEPQKKALDELKALIQEALNKREFTAPPPPPAKEEKPAPPAAAASEEAVTEEAKKPEVVIAEESTPTEEAKKPEEGVTEPPKAEGEEKISVVEEVVEKLTVVDEDGAKTVEAIEETIVSVSTTPVAEPEEVKEEEAEVPVEPEEVFIWGIPLLGDDKSDVILLKFLRARDFKAKDAFTMIKNTVLWRKEFGIEAILDEDLGNELGKVVFTQGTDKKGHPVCYNVYGEFQNKELYQSAFADEEKRTKFLKWRIQFLEKSIRKLDFSPTGINTIVQVNDLKNSPGPAKRELRQATNQALTLLQDNYPEFVAKQVFINVPWWYLAFNRMISPFLTQRTRSKFVFAGPSKSAETLFKYIAPEQVPVQYGGLSRQGEQEFTTADPVTEVTIKPATKHTVEFPVSETGLIVWEVRVVGWDVSYGAEFVPGAEDGYTVIVQKARKIAPADEPVISNSFKVGEPGKVVLTFDNQSSKKKKLLYRSKSKACSE